MADKSGTEKGAAEQERPGRPETAEELLARAAELLERRGGERQKSYQSAARQVRVVLDWLEGRK